MSDAAGVQGAPSASPERLAARAARERRARIEAERIAEGALADLYSRQRELELLEAVAVASNTAREIGPALQGAVDAVCAHTGWPVGHAWLPAEDGSRLVPTGVWHLDDAERFAVFRQVTEARTFAHGEGLPGRVFASGEPAWIPDVHADDNFPRAGAAADIGVGAAFAFPILIGDATVGVLEFFSPTVTEPDTRLLEVVAHVGTQLGRVIERDRAGRELKIGSEELRRYAAELEQANDELKEFAYVASHDLSEPLRTISGFVQLLSSRYGDRLDEDAHEFIGFVVDGTERMQALIEGLLSYSRVGRTELHREPVDLSALVERTRESISATIEEAGAALEVGPLPTVSGDAGQLDRLFHNLISNAVKFRGDDAPVIRISAERADGAWQFAVADNGIGIEERHVDRIFDVFQRLHGPDEYAGTGIGLSICKKVVERHGGRIWVESTPGTGSTFRFTIPITEAAEEHTGC